MSNTYLSIHWHSAAPSTHCSLQHSEYTDDTHIKTKIEQKNKTPTEWLDERQMEKKKPHHRKRALKS